MGSLPAKVRLAALLLPLVSAAGAPEELGEAAAFVPRAVIVIAGIANSVAESAAANVALRGHANLRGLFIALRPFYRHMGGAEASV